VSDNAENKYGVKRRMKDGGGLVTNWYSTKSAQKAALKLAERDPRVSWAGTTKR
jgi:hypothetical protein